MSKKRHAMDLRILVGQILTAVCFLRSFFNLFGNVLAGNGLALVATIISAVALACVFITVKLYYGTPEIAQLPVAAMALFVCANLLRVFCVNWSYLFFVIPLALLILLALRQDWGMWGIAAGGSMILLTFIVGLISFRSGAVGTLANEVVRTAGSFGSEALAEGVSRKISSLYLASLFFDSNSLMGIATILYFCIIPRPARSGVTSNIYSRPGGSSGSSGFGGNSGGFGGSSGFGGGSRGF